MCGSEEIQRLVRARKYLECRQQAYNKFMRNVDLKRFMECLKQNEVEE